ncbi:MAG: PQQ-dependent sugar dehydrogenase, partial [Phaeodactylibacter sp.]|nr:PQQ-dependent sugar dehydrogenase [Phaeodactylibacter sp.]
MKKHLIFLFPVLLLLAKASTAQNLDLPDGFVAEMIADSLNPVGMKIDHHGRIWLFEKDGVVRILDETGELLPDPFITLAVDDFNERGLLGLALHPDFDNQPYVYLYYTVPDGNYNRLSRFIANGDVAIPGSEEILLEAPMLSGTIHNGGAMTFGIDGKLYLALGDGANSATAQSTNTILGKILRLNADGTIPDDNPFYDSFSGDQRAIWSLGLRNPFSMTQTADGRIFICDVGNGAFEEVNEIFPGKNYGWNLIEGPLPTGVDPPADYQDPLFAYSHDDGCAIVGAAIYEPEESLFPAGYQGKFFFADYCEGYIKYLSPEPGASAETFATGIDRPLALATDQESGNFYFLARGGLGGGSQIDNTSTNDGTLWRVFYTGNGVPFIYGQPQGLLLPVGETASFQVSVFGTEPLELQWQINGVDVPDSDSTLFELSDVQLTDDGAQIRCIATNAEGADTSVVAILSVTDNQRPLPQIDQPTAGSLFRAGDVITFSGQATDPEEGTLPADALTWRIDWHHDAHTHPGLGPLSGIFGGELTVPVVNETDPDVWYRIYLTATDTEGLSKTTFLEIFPELATLEVNGTTGVPINIDGLVREQPYSTASLVGIQRTLQAPMVHFAADTAYFFQNWTDGTLTDIQSFQMPDTGKVIGALYESFPLGQGIGLYGEYFDDPELDLLGAPQLTRIDSIIYFLWGDGSPDDNVLPDDYFSVRWTGNVQAVFGEEYTFYVKSDDGCRLWIGDTLLIDQWVPQPPTEHSGSLILEAGERYPIRLEYMEVAGGAEVTLRWSSARTPKQVIPSRQLDPYADRASVSGTVWLDENGNDLFDPTETPLENVTVLLYEATSNSLMEVSTTDVAGYYAFDFLPDGSYYLFFLSFPTGLELYPGFGLLPNGQTPGFQLIDEEDRLIDVAFLSSPSALGSLSSVARQFRLFPNPAADEVTLQWAAVQGGEVHLLLRDAAGR